MVEYDKYSKKSNKRGIAYALIINFTLVLLFVLGLLTLEFNGFLVFLLLYNICFIAVSSIMENAVKNNGEEKA